MTTPQPNSTKQAIKLPVRVGRPSLDFRYNLYESNGRCLCDNLTREDASKIILALNSRDDLLAAAEAALRRLDHNPDEIEIVTQLRAAIKAGKEI